MACPSDVVYPVDARLNFDCRASTVSLVADAGLLGDHVAVVMRFDRFHHAMAVVPVMVMVMHVTVGDNDRLSLCRP
jgi:hypothetical protein